ncbi:MAG: hypothetical protein H6Q41_2698 [Deltaproteobacteria bacterium]|nr:hypothetical protein [Deltaproteobacteria bacterium]
MRKKFLYRKIGLCYLKDRGGKGLKVGGSAMGTKEGDTVRSILNGIEYKVKRIEKSMAVLESQDGKSKIVTEVDTLKLFYREKEDVKV